MALLQRYTIVDGPDLDELFLAFRFVEAGKETEFKWISSEDIRQVAVVRINAIQTYADDNHPDGGMWLIQANGPDLISGQRRNYVLDYSTQSRSGWIIFCDGEDTVSLMPMHCDGGDVGREGLYIRIIDEQDTYVGPFASGNERKEFLKQILEQAECDGDCISAEATNAVPMSEYCLLPDEFLNGETFEDSESPDDEDEV